METMGRTLKGKPLTYTQPGQQRQENMLYKGTMEDAIIVLN
jgi:hypothetical protein